MCAPAPVQVTTKGKVMLNFILMTVFFALNHGTVTAVIPLATPQFGEDLGDISLGVLYGFYTLTALFASTLIVEKLGQKWSLLAGCAVYTLYILGNLLGVVTHGWVRSFIVILAGAFGGIAAGFLWTAQGGYFSRAAKAYAAASEMDEKKTTAFFSAVFASVYLAFEVVIKISSSLVVFGVCGSHWYGSFLTGSCGTQDETSPDYEKSDFIEHLKWKGIVVTYSVFLAVAVISTFGMLFIKNIDAPTAPKDVESTPLVQKAAVEAQWTRKALAAVNLMRSRPEILLVGMFNIQFGVTSAYLNTYVTGTIIKNSLGKDKVGYFTAIIPLVASAFAFPLTWISNATNGDKTIGMVIGMLSWLTFGLVFFGTDLAHDESDALTTKLGSWGTLVPLFVVFGIGRSCWEGINKAVFADMFKDQTEAAFATLIVQLGLTSTATFIGYRFLGNLPKEIIMVSVGVITLVSYFAAMRVYKQRLDTDAAESQ